MKIYKKTIYLIIALSLLITPFMVSATNASSDANNSGIVVHDQMLNRLTTVGSGGGYKADITPPEIVGSVIKIAISFLGLIFIILAIISGYSWMTANGNEEKVKKAQTTLKEAIIGLVISISVWTLWSFIFEKLIINGS